MKVVVRKANALDALHLAADIRPADMAELHAAVGDMPVHAVVASAKVDEAWACEVDGKLLALWGVSLLDESALIGRRGWGWLLTTKLVEQYPKLFWVLTKAELRKILSRWSSLTNYVDVRHEQALRWGARLGFIFDGPAAYGVSGLPAQRFVVTKESFNVCTRSHSDRRRGVGRHSSSRSPGEGSS